MKSRLFIIVLCLSLATWASATTRVTVIHNDQVVAYEELVHQAENESGSEGMKAGHPNVTVFLSGGLMSLIPENGDPVTKTVRRGDVMFRELKDGRIRSIAADEIHVMRVEFPGKGSTGTRGASRLPAGGKLLLENSHTRVYEIRIPAGSDLPFETPIDCALVVLSGAQLRHGTAQGREESLNLRTNRCVWRPARTGPDRNISKTDLWVIAVEPK